VAQHRAVAGALEGISTVPAGGVGARLRMVKDAGEIGFLKKAGEITDGAFRYALTVAGPGVTEIELVAEIRYHLAKRYMAQPAFEFIAASGANGSMPHAIPTERKIAAGDMVTLDFGAEYMGYKADMTRTFAVGQPSGKMREVYGIVKEAQKRGAEALGPGKACKDIDAVARGYIAEQGYGEYFGHGLGHGVGLQIHERPNLKPVSEDVLAPGMAVTMEPGIYIPGAGGVRIEDTCVITGNGWESLFTSNKDLIIL
jgi:Xaa-Pro aminopeptidase